MKELSIEEKELLLKDLCGRLPYGVICNDSRHGDSRITEIDTVSEVVYFDDVDEYVEIKNCKPYLRPLSSMTKEEKEELFQLMGNGTDVQRIDFYLSHYLDFRCLIPMGIAIEALEDMYNTKEK